MDNNIIEPNSEFDFAQITLAQPTGIQGGAYFTKILCNNRPLYIQTPTSLTRQGFVKSGKKIYSDLMFDANNEEFINWMENLETKCQTLIFDKSETWFQNSLELNDIESAFNSPLKSYKSGKKYLVRTNVKMNSLTNSPIIKIYNESETMLAMDDVKSETNIVSILEVQGIRFTTRNFQIDIELKQVMVMNVDEIFESCVIKKNGSVKKKAETNLENTDSDKIDEITESVINSMQFEVDTEEPKLEPVKVSLEEPLVQLEVEIKENVIEDVMDDTMMEMKPFELTLDDNLETITLKKPNEVYYELYKEARVKAKQAKKDAVLAYLEAKNIKQTYMLEDMDSSDDDENLELEEYE